MSLLFAKAVSAAGSPPADGRGDFDFLAGRWAVTHRRLRRRLAGDADWEVFGGAAESRPIIGGLGNIDDNILELPAGTYRAATVRLFEPRAGTWSIWWVDSRAMRLEPPVRGGFGNGIGTFTGDDRLAGRPIRVRFIWSEITATSARWEQAFSADGGAAWETNWIMEFRRTA